MCKKDFLTAIRTAVSLEERNQGEVFFVGMPEYQSSRDAFLVSTADSGRFVFCPDQSVSVDDPALFESMLRLITTARKEAEGDREYFTSLAPSKLTAKFRSIGADLHEIC